MRAAHVITAFLAAIALSFVACGGGGGSSPTDGGILPAPEPSSAGTATPSPAPSDGTNSATVVIQAQSTSVPLPPITGYSGTIAMPAGSGTVTVVSSAHLPAGIPAPGGITPYMYVSFKAAGGPALMNQTPGFRMGVTSGMMGSQQYYMAQYEDGVWFTAEGPGMMSGSWMTMDPAAAPIHLNDGDETCFAWYAGSPMRPPSPWPSMMPSPYPSWMPSPYPSMSPHPSSHPSSHPSMMPSAYPSSTP